VAEGGLDELALRLPGGAIVGKEAFAEDELERGVIARLLKARGSANKHGLDVVRVRELANGNMEKTEKGDVTEVVRTALAKARPVVGQFPQVTQEEVTLWTGRTRDESSGGHREMVRQKRGNRKSAIANQKSVMVLESQAPEVRHGLVESAYLSGTSALGAKDWPKR